MGLRHTSDRRKNDFDWDIRDPHEVEGGTAISVGWKHDGDAFARYFSEVPKESAYSIIIAVEKNWERSR
jgi:hypothetical protein